VSFQWTAEAIAKARRVFVEGRRPPIHVARCIGSGCTGPAVVALARAQGWYAERGGRIVADPAVELRLRALYVDQALTAKAAAEQMGPPWTEPGVRKFAQRRGWCEARAVVVKARRREAELQKIAARPAIVAKPMPPPFDLQAAVAAAIAGGRLTVLPTRYAAGLTRIEDAFWAAGAGVATDWRRSGARR
jgi:hypothetical protein